MLLNIVITIAGFVILIKSADYFVGGAASFAKNFKIPTIVIGLTIVAFATSAPELAISFSSHLSGNADMVFGNVFGSSISNILMILGLAVVIRPFNIEGDVIKNQIPILLLITAGVSVMFLDSLFYPGEINTLSRSEGIMLILFFTIFVFYLIVILKNSDKTKESEPPQYKTLISALLMVLGLAGIIWSSDLVVDNAAIIAEGIGVSQKIISVTIISVGTSLPELITTITAAKKGENGMAIGNIVGSNIFNIAIVLGLPIATLGGISTTAFGIVDVLYMFLAVLALWIFSAINRDLRRYEGGILIVIYATYVIYIFVQ